MNDLHVTVEPERIVTSTLILRPWSVEDAGAALEIYGDPSTARGIGRREPVRDLAEMRELLGHWNLRSSQSPPPQGLWAVEAADDGRLLGGATLLPFSSNDPRLVMGWHLQPQARGQGVAGQIGHALAHQAFVASDAEEVFVAVSAHDRASLAVGRRLGMSSVDDVAWAHAGVGLKVLRLSRTNLHKIRPGISMDNSYDPEGLGDW
jgi:RimJ/RimL family protein N-acetyltransferase